MQPAGMDPSSSISDKISMFQELLAKGLYTVSVTFKNKVSGFRHFCMQIWVLALVAYCKFFSDASVDWINKTWPTTRPRCLERLCTCVCETAIKCNKRWVHARARYQCSRAFHVVSVAVLSLIHSFRYLHDFISLRGTFNKVGSVLLYRSSCRCI